jgi:hypothetical protein
LAVIARALPEEENPLMLWVLKTLNERIHHFIKRGTPKLNLMLCLFNLIAYVNLELLETLQEMISAILR